MGINEEKAQGLLNLTDWTQLPDCGLTDVCISNFKSYRESLRTIRRTNPDNPTFT